jgi:PIN domain nuclease of toxin-antitoxin system
MHHRDPFDRMLICQALNHDLTIVTTDEWFNRYAAKDPDGRLTPRVLKKVG